MTAIDQRIAIRRHTVRETGARRRLRHIAVALAFVVTVGLIALLLQSPVMAIRDIEVAGAKRANVEAVLDRFAIAPGVPTISVRPAELAAAVEDDPWVARAQATVTWPGTVSLVVLEHKPVGWVEIDKEWYRASGTGAILEAAVPGSKAAKVKLRNLRGTTGDTLKGKRVLAALEFLAVLPVDLRAKAVITGAGEGKLVARVHGHLVDLGGPVDMVAKAATLTALLEEDIPPGSAISLVSPSRPAVSPPTKPVRNPQQVVEG